jgi:hypothetical protein
MEEEIGNYSIQKRKQKTKQKHQQCLICQKTNNINPSKFKDFQ